MKTIILLLFNGSLLLKKDIMIDKENFDFYNEYYDLIIDYEQANTDACNCVLDRVNKIIYDSKEFKKIYTGRCCKYCLRPITKTNFTKKEHMYSDFLHNKVFISKNLECDECNAYFGEHFENDLYNYLVEILSFNSTKGKNHIAHLVSKEDKKKGLKINDIYTNPNTKDVNIELKGKYILGENNLKLEITKKSYYLLNVYKQLLKMALSTIPISEYANVTMNVDFLKTNDIYQTEMFFKVINKSLLSEDIRVMLYKRKTNEIENDTILPYFVFAFMDKNYLLQVPVYSNDDHQKFSQKEYKTHFKLIPLDFNELSLKKYIYKELDKNEKNPNMTINFEKKELVDDK